MFIDYFQKKLARVATNHSHIKALGKLDDNDSRTTFTTIWLWLVLTIVKRMTLEGKIYDIHKKITLNTQF
jgi:hypothetical protein